MNNTKQTLMAAKSAKAAKAMIAAVALCGAAAGAQAQTANFTQWTNAGDTLIALGDTRIVTLTTAATLSGEQTNNGGNGALEYFELEPALFLTGGALAADTFEGSGVQQSFNTAAGTTISFNWSLSTMGFNAAQADRAFVLVDGGLVLPLGTVAASTVGGSFSYSFSSAGSHALAIVVMDVNDYAGVSRLVVSNLAVTPVPEAGTWALMAGGLAAMAALARRRRTA